MNRTQERAAGNALSAAERRHLLRRLAFTATPELDRAVQGMSADEALSVLVRAARDAPYPQRAEAANGIWSNPALRFASLSDEDFEAIVDRQTERARAAIEEVRRWWLAELLTAPAPLRENLVLFLHAVFGSSTGCCWGWTLPRRSPLRLAVHALRGSTTFNRWPMDSPTPPASSTAPGPGRAPASTIPTRRSANPSGGPAT